MATSVLSRRDFTACLSAGTTLLLTGCANAADTAPGPVLLDSINGRRFVQFLKDCTPAERVQLAQSLDMLPGLEKTDFGQFGLPVYESFTDDAKVASTQRPLRPKSFNELPPKMVLAAVKARRIDSELTTPYRIISRLVHTCYNEVLGSTVDRNEIDYDGIVRWVATKKGVTQEEIAKASTDDLERLIAKKYLAQIWDRLSVEQRREILIQIEKQTGSTIADKAAIAAMGGGAAIAALGTTVAMTGFAFYTTMSVVISTAAGFLGLTLPMWAYAGASSTVAILSGPIGWTLAAVGILGGMTYLALPNVDKTAAFVITMNVVKASRQQSGSSSATPSPSASRPSASGSPAP